jgi:medium-chain acyl-[acyl-carrier-protein] hydrolase
MGPLLDAAYTGLSSHLRGRYAFFGHSMGAMVAYGLAGRIAAAGGQGPVAVIASGCNAPSAPSREESWRDLSTADLREKLRVLGGTPAEVFDNPELTELLLATFRPDAAVCETHELAKQAPLECPIIAYGGHQDQYVSVAHLDLWRTHTTGRFSRRLFAGGHYFIHDAEDTIHRTLHLDLELFR